MSLWEVPRLVVSYQIAITGLFPRSFPTSPTGMTRESVILISTSGVVSTRSTKESLEATDVGLAGADETVTFTSPPVEDGESSACRASHAVTISESTRANGTMARFFLGMNFIFAHPRNSKHTQYRTPTPASGTPPQAPTHPPTSASKSNYPRSTRRPVTSFQRLLQERPFEAPLRERWLPAFWATRACVYRKRLVGRFVGTLRPTNLFRQTGRGRREPRLLLTHHLQSNP